MKKTKYMMSAGLAFAEESDMNKLSKQSLKGWHLERFSFLGYRLVRGEPEDIVYTIDYHTVKEADKEEYVEMFASAGWEYVCTEGNMHIFKAAKGTKPIYTDRETTKEKYHRLFISWSIGSFILLVFLLVSNYLSVQQTGWMEKLGVIGFTISIILFVPACMTTIGLFVRKIKSKT